MTATQAILEKIRSDPKIPVPSQSVFKILELTRDLECRMDRVADEVSRDSGLTAHLLHEANSALYGFQTATSSVNEACVRLGLKRVRAAVINRHVVDGLGKLRPDGFQPHRYWQSAFAISIAARDLCRLLLPKMADEAGTAGLLCDFGVGLLAFGAPKEYQQVLAAKAEHPTQPIHKIEQRIMGLTHAQVGAIVLADWKLDQALIDAVRYHHLETTGVPDQAISKFTRIVAAAASLSDIAVNGSDMEQVENLYRQIDELTPDADTMVSRLLDGLLGDIQTSADAFSLDLGPLDIVEAHVQEAAEHAARCEHTLCRSVSAM